VICERLQSNHEGILIDTLHANIDKADGAIITTALRAVVEIAWEKTSRSP